MGVIPVNNSKNKNFIMKSYKKSMQETKNRDFDGWNELTRGPE